VRKSKERGEARRVHDMRYDDDDDDPRMEGGRWEEGHDTGAGILQSAVPPASRGTSILA
jgi:hypothetical protein